MFLICIIKIINIINNIINQKEIIANEIFLVWSKKNTARSSVYFLTKPQNTYDCELQN